METVATGILILLALIAFNNWKAGQLGTWFKAKFFNQTPTVTA